jgi:hypothetical protein
VDVYQCPDCALKFRYSSELDQHLKLEHPNFKSEERSVDDDLIHASRRHRRKKRDLRPER